MFEQGALVVSITGRVWHSVGINEAHEMLINPLGRNIPQLDYPGVKLRGKGGHALLLKSPLH